MPFGNTKSRGQLRRTSTAQAWNGHGRGLGELNSASRTIEVIEEDTAIYDHAISVWARSDPEAKAVFERTLRKRFDFAAWMFKQCGFSERQAKVRGRLLVAYLMGESAADLKSDPKWKSAIEEIHKLLTRPRV